MNPSLSTRYAPTPSGYLHLGNLFNFILTRLLAKLSGGTTLLRIDDNDDARVKTEYLDDIFQTLEFAGLGYETGPSGVEDFRQNWSQTLRRPMYEQGLETLKQSGHLFACNCSRSRLQTIELQNHYDGHCEHLGLDFYEPDICWRISVAKNQTIELNDGILGYEIIKIGNEPGSFVVRRKDAIAAYQVASLTDDVHFGINAVVRGHDLLQSTGMQLFLAKQLNLAQFSQAHFWHHPLIVSPGGTKLSKSAGDTSIQFFRLQGGKIQDVFRHFCDWIDLPVSHNLKRFSELEEHLGEHVKKKYL